MFTVNNYYLPLMEKFTVNNYDLPLISFKDTIKNY